MDASDIITIISTAGLVLGLLLLGGGGLLLWRLNRGVDRLEHSIEQLAGQIQEMQEELREMIRRDNQQMSQALAPHAHDENGHPVFGAPVGME